MQIWAIRHASTNASLEGRLQGQLDYPLCEHGRWEAQCLAYRLQQVKFTHSYCSPLQRTRETAQTILAGRNVPLNVNRRFQEYGWGILEGLTWDEIYLLYPNLYHKIKNVYWWTKVPGRESRRRFMARVKASYYYLSSHNFSRDIILLVSHGRFLNAFISYLVKGNLSQKWEYAPSPASVSLLERVPGKDNFILRIFNDCQHLFT